MCSWSDCSKKVIKERRDYIMENPYPCDDCGDTYNKNDLINHFRQGYKICKNCIDEYFETYK